MPLTIFNIRTSSLPPQKTIPISSHPPVSPTLSPLHSLIYLLSPRICLYWKLHVNGIIQLTDFSGWLLSFTTMFSRFFYSVACFSTSALLSATLQWHASWRYHIWSTHSLVDRHFCYFHILAIINNSSMKSCVQVLCEYVFNFLG